MIEHHTAPIWSKYLLIMSAAGLLAIWALPETIALRHLFLLTGLVSGALILKHNFLKLRHKSSWPVWLLGLFYGWLLVHLAFFSQEFSIQFVELRSVWARSLVSSLIGLAVGLLLQTSEAKSKNYSDNSNFSYFTAILWIGFSAQAWIIFISYLLSMLKSGQGTQFDIYHFLYGLYQTKPAYVVFLGLSLPLSYALLLGVLQRHIPRWALTPLVLTILITPFGGFFIESKNAMALFGLSTLIFFIAALFTIIRLPKISPIPLITLVLIGSAGTFGLYKHLERTNSWLVMTENMKIGGDIDHHNFWKNRETFPRPVNSNGQPVDISTYERTAWFTAGLHLLRENPQGYGLVHHSFGSLAITKWPDFYQPRGQLKGATHSGWLDLALGIGLPGITIIWICLLAAWIRSLKGKGLWYTYASWGIPITVLTYLIAEVSGSHYLEALFFMTALFCSLTLPPSKELSSKA